MWQPLLKNSAILADSRVLQSNSLRPSDTTWRHTSGSTLAQLVTCYLTELSYYLNQCWLVISEVLWLLNQSNFTSNAQAIILYNEFKNYTFARFPRGQWVKISECLSLTRIMESVIHCQSIQCRSCHLSIILNAELLTMYRKKPQ